MLPLLPSPPARLPSPTAPVPGVLLAMLLAMLLLLGGCSRVGQPPRGVLLEALTLQIQLTQGAIARALDLQADGLPEVSRVRVDGQEAVAIGPDRGLHLTGRFDWRLPGDVIRVDSPFELYLQPGPRGESWRLARPSGSSDGSRQDWITDPLPLPRRSRG
ncbi:MULTISPECIES: hypothetical protein [Cyanophyceae]|uniref:Lipoprotein n=1 Tax=Aphanothece cf. minutissima CCALA 015 TaxID=2107695 RepID=A0ABX5FCZ1_9CHRO|nr:MULTISPECIES: hypothetical protein [Cyanophyceae]MCP9798619.1 hypothetical protein [Cyanobium sp. Lug-B]MCP9932841.1 hypothetical protein [Cyanobium sp. Candia 9D4]PSB38623.1 hypothetical protein C7B81_03420 [Aphanothece cf. minutissima CCALA 015]